MTEKKADEKIRKELFYQRKNGYELIGVDEQVAVEDYCTKYMAYLNASRTEREAVVNAVNEAREQGFEEGYHRGLVEGGQEAFIAVQEKLDEIQQLAELVAEERHREYRKEDQTLIALAMEIARKIMKKTARLEEDVLEKMLEEVLSEHEGKCKVVISEYQRTLDIKVDKSLARRLKAFSKNVSIVFVKEEDLILVETGSGVVDLRIPVQLAHLDQALEK